MNATYSVRNFIIKYKQYSQLKKNVFSGTIFSICNTIITLLSYPIYLQYLGAEKYGLWSIVAVVFSFSQFGQMGTDTAVTKYVANEYGRGNRKAITEYLSTAFYILLFPSFIVVSCLLIFRSQIADFIKLSEVFREGGIKLILFVGLLSVFSFFVHTIKGLIVGIGRMDIANYVFLGGRVLNISVALLLLVLGYDVWSLYFGFLAYFLVPAVIWTLMLKYKFHIKMFEFNAFNKDKMRELVKFGGTLGAGIIAQMFVVPFNKLIIGRYIGLSEVAYYAIAVKVVMSIRNLFVKGLESILPKISEVYGDGKDSFPAVLNVHKKGMKIIFVFALPLFFIVFMFAETLMSIWLGPEFNIQIAVVLKILLVGWLVNAFAVPDYFMFLGIGKVGYSVSATCIKSISNVFLVMAVLFFSINITLYDVVIIDSISLSMAVVFLKFKYLSYKKNHLVAMNK